MKKQYIPPHCEDLSLTTPDLMQDSLGVLGGSGNRINNGSLID